MKPKFALIIIICLCIIFMLVGCENNSENNTPEISMNNNAENYEIKHTSNDTTVYSDEDYGSLEEVYDWNREEFQNFVINDLLDAGYTIYDPNGHKVTYIE